MCGISVVVDFRPTSRDAVTKPQYSKAELEEQMAQSLELIKHRGPDSRGTWISDDNTVVLGHVRLAIIDLSPQGAQPLHDSDNHLHAVVNGEIYDHERLREELIQKFNYPFKSHSDSELVVALYKFYGLNFLAELRGEFSLCLYDSLHRQFVAARDRYGIKPLFWTIVNGRLLVAAEQKAFLPFGWKPEWDVKAIMDQSWSTNERTMFEHVRKVRPGHYLIVDTDTGHLEQRQYWDLDYPDKHTKDPRSVDDMIKQVREHMLEAVRLRLRADVPVGIYLSGGIDSSVLAGMTAHLVREQGARMGSGNAKDRICCFSIEFDEEGGYNEQPIAKRTAEHLDVSFQSIHMNEEKLAESYEDAVWHCEHYFSDLNVIGKYALSKVVTDAGFKVVLTGEGADEHFGGYPLYQADFLREPDQTVEEGPSMTKMTDSERQARLAQIEAENKAEYERIGGNTAGWEQSVPRSMLNNIMTCAYMTAFNYSFYAPWTAELGHVDAMLTVANNVNGIVRDKINKQWHPLHSAQYVWTHGHLSNIFLSCLGDRCEMAHSLEARTPFLDHHLTEYVNHLPPSVKVKVDDDHKTMTEKWILREAAKPFITEELYKRRKHPYSAPILYPVGGPIHKVVEKVLTEENVTGLGFVDWQKAKEFLKGFEQQDSLAIRQAFAISQLIILGKRFGVAQAKSRKSLTDLQPASRGL